MLLRKVFKVKHFFRLQLTKIIITGANYEVTVINLCLKEKTSLFYLVDLFFCWQQTLCPQQVTAKKNTFKMLM